MKKVIIIIAAALISLTANAQAYVGGAVSFDSSDPSTYTFAPEVGYSFNSTWSAGVVLGLGGQKDVYNSFYLTPYVRWTFLEDSPVKVFLDGAFCYGSYNPKAANASDLSGFQVAVKPGIAIPVNDRLSFVGHFGYLGYTSADTGFSMNGHADGFGLGLSGNDFSAGLYLSF